MTEHWFLTEPVLYGVYCLHEQVENAAMPCAVRAGQGRIEYNPLVLNQKTYREVEQLFRIELIRLLLKHPYERRPERCSGEVISLGSDITIGDNYCFVRSKEKLPLQTPEAYHLPLGQSYEYYCHELSQQKENEDNRDEENHSRAMADGDTNERKAQSALWQEDERRAEQINLLIEHTDDWGQMPSEVVERIRQSMAPRLQREQVWAGFRSSVVATGRVLTRMRPNRRTGWSGMGARRSVGARIWVALDVSASVRKEKVDELFAWVRRLQMAGEVEVDVSTFDVTVSEPQRWQFGVEQSFCYHGGGGTRFEAVLEFAEQHRHKYDGIIILTDGMAPTEGLHRVSVETLWVLVDEPSYRRSNRILAPLGRRTYLV